MVSPEHIASLAAKADEFDRVGSGYKVRSIEDLNSVEVDLERLISEIRSALQAMEGSDFTALSSRAETALRKAENCRSYVGFIAHMKRPNVGGAPPTSRGAS